MGVVTQIGGQEVLDQRRDLVRLIYALAEVEGMRDTVERTPPIPEKHFIGEENARHATCGSLRIKQVPEAEECRVGVAQAIAFRKRIPHLEGIAENEDRAGPRILPFKNFRNERKETANARILENEQFGFAIIGADDFGDLLADLLAPPDGDSAPIQWPPIVPRAPQLRQHLVVILNEQLRLPMAGGVAFLVRPHEPPGQRRACEAEHPGECRRARTVHAEHEKAGARGSLCSHRHFLCRERGA